MINTTKNPQSLKTDMINGIDPNIYVHGLPPHLGVVVFGRAKPSL